MKLLLVVFGILVILGAASYLGYLLVFSSPATVAVVQTPLPTLRIANSGSAEAIEQTPFVATSSTQTGSRLVKISSGPVVRGIAVVTKAAETASSTSDIDIRFIERRSGNVYSYLVRAHALTRLSNRTIPGIQSASWSPSGALALVRYLSGPSLSVVNTYALPADGSGGFFLSQNLADSSVSSTTILTLASGVNGSIVSTSRLDGTRVAQAFSTPLSQMLVSFLGKTDYLAVTKASAALDGYVYSVGGTGGFSRLAGPLKGLTALASPSGKWALVTSADDTGPHAALVNVATNDILPLPLGTFSEKCAWAADDSAVYCGVPVSPPNGSYPDDWYQGTVSLSDRIWKISVDGRYAQLVLDLGKEAGSTFDVYSLSIDRNRSVLGVVNKIDGSLWSYEL